jgi:hypothetical protein
VNREPGATERCERDEEGGEAPGVVEVAVGDEETTNLL